ncbi:hypothetical protein Bca101_006040 [Brassica carinata]
MKIKLCLLHFDTAMTKLTGVRTAELVNPMGHVEPDPRSCQLPQFLQDNVGNTYIFHLKLSEFSFSANYKSFTGGGNNPDGDMHGENCASCKFHFGDSPTGRKPQKDGDEPKDQSDA